MDKRLEDALAFGKYRETLENRKQALQRRLEAMLVVHYDNGMFVANQETISFIGTMVASGYKDGIVLDVKNKPVEISDLEEFKNKLMTTYFTATNEYSSEMKQLTKARDVRKAMNW